MRWLNVHPLVMRHGVVLEDLSTTQRQAALSLLEASLSTAGGGASNALLGCRHD